MTRYYLDASVAYRVLAQADRGSVGWWRSVNAGESDEIHASEILRTELVRILRRDREDAARHALITEHVAEYPLDREILRLAEAIGPHIATLDAIHLATAQALGIVLTIVTHDARMRAVAGRLGFAVLDPVTG